MSGIAQSDERTIRSVIAQHGLLKDRKRSKKLSQNFLTDVLCLESCIPDLSPYKVFEVGPGPGGLTRLLLSRTPKALCAVEFDEDCVRALQPLVDAPRVRVIHGDAKNISPHSVWEDHNFDSVPIVIAGNLPYHIGTHLLVQWLHELENIAGMYLMFQKEVVDRLAARPGSNDYGRLSVITQLCCEVDPLLVLPPEWFTPSPAVFSAFVYLKPKANRPDLETMKRVENLTQALFSKRRKMIGHTLSESDIEGISGVSLKQRPEELSPEVFLEIAKRR